VQVVADPLPTRYDDESHLSPGVAGRLLAEGPLSGSVAPEAIATLGTVAVDLPREEFAGAILEMEWGEGETNSYHVLAARDGWFSGPGAFVASPARIQRFGSSL
jgi:hypothetical protein